MTELSQTSTDSPSDKKWTSSDELNRSRLENAVQKNRVSRVESIATVDPEGQHPIPVESTSETNSNPEEQMQKIEVLTTPLPENIYSIMYLSDLFSGSFMFAVAVFSFQAAMTCLAMIGLIDASNQDNPLDIPEDVVVYVRIAQFLAVILAVALQDDVKESIQTLHVGYNACAADMNKNATYEKWLFSYVLQLVTGMAFLVATFILVMEADSVVDIFLNFAALEFITQIDDVAFKFADQGYTTIRVKMVCEEVKRHEIPDLRRSFPIHRVLLALFVGAMLLGWGVIFRMQTSGVFVCGAFFVQFGDAYQTFLPTYSGYYDAQSSRVDGRQIYKLRGFDGEKAAFFRYCRNEEFWVFQTALTSGNKSYDDDEVCENYLMRSEDTTTFDMKTLDVSKWTIHRDETRAPQSPTDLVLIDHLYMDCAEECKGSCQSECPDDRFGDFCELEIDCARIVLNRNTRPFTPGEVSQTSQYSILEYNDTATGELKPARVHNRPVYAFDATAFGDENIYYILFNGRRWIMKGYFLDSQFQEEDLTYYYRDNDNLDLDANADEDTKYAYYVALGLLHTQGKEALAQLFLEDQFHLMFSELGAPAEFISGPVDFGTPFNSILPTEIEWFEAGPWTKRQYDIGQSVETEFLCQICDDERNACFHGGTCAAGVCDCEGAGYFELEGALCEKEKRCPSSPCANGGICNVEWAECDCPEGFHGPLCEEIF